MSQTRLRPLTAPWITALLVLVTVMSGCSDASRSVPPDSTRPAPSLADATVPSSINHTCATNDTLRLGNWLYSLPQGSRSKPTTVDFGTGCYLVSGTLFLRDFRHFIFEGGKFEQGRPVTHEFAGPGPNRPAYCGSGTYSASARVTDTLQQFALMFFMEGGCYLTFKDMTLVGTNTAGGVYKSEQDTFITFAGSQYGLVDNVNMQGPYGDYVDAQALHEVTGGLQGEYPATNITVENSTLGGSGRQGIGVILANHINIQHDRFLSAWATVFDIEFDVHGGHETDIRIADNTIVGRHYAYVLSAQTGAEVERLEFSGNQLIDGAQMRIVIVDGITGNNVRINNNYASAVSTASDGAQPAIRIQNITGSTIEIDHNTVPNDKAGFAFLPSGALLCANGPGTPKCPAVSPVSNPATATLP